MRTTRIRIKKWTPERVSFREASVWYHMSCAWATPAQAHLDALFHSLAKKGQNTPESSGFRRPLQLFYKTPISTHRNFGRPVPLFLRRILLWVEAFVSSERQKRRKTTPKCNQGHTQIPNLPVASAHLGHQTERTENPISALLEQPLHNSSIHKGLLGHYI